MVNFIVNFRINRTFRVVGGNSNSRLPVAIQRSLLQKMCLFNFKVHHRNNRHFPPRRRGFLTSSMQSVQIILKSTKLSTEQKEKTKKLKIHVTILVLIDFCTSLGRAKRPKCDVQNVLNVTCKTS